MSNHLIEALYLSDYLAANELHKNGVKLSFSQYIFIDAINKNNINLFHWLISHGYKLNNSIIELLYKSNNFNQFINTLDMIELIDLLYILKNDEIKKIHNIRNLLPFKHLLKKLGHERCDHLFLNWCDNLALC